MSDSRFQFGLGDLFAAAWACGFLAAMIVNPNSTWLMLLAIGSIVWGGWQLRHADRRLPTRWETYRILLIFVGATLGAIAVGAIVIYAVLKSGSSP